MSDFWFYLQLGLQHVLDFNAYEHILFLWAMTLPFSFKHWKKVLLLVTVFTITHCLALVASVFKIVTVEPVLIEFFIPVTILFTAMYTIFFAKSEKPLNRIVGPTIATAFFGGIHGFGFSTYFKLLISGASEKTLPLLGFAGGIEIVQSIIVFSVLVLGYIFKDRFRFKGWIYVTVSALIIVVITIPLLIKTFPW